MRFKQIIENTTAGSVASVAKPLMTQTRENTNVRGLEPVQKVMKGQAKKKGPYANSISEGKVKQLAQDLKELTPHQFQDKYKQSKSEVRADMKKVNEDDLSEQDLIVIPGQGRLKRTGFVKHDLDHGEHEGETLKNSLHTIIRVATHLDKALSMSSEFPEWVSEKIGATKSMMVSVMDYLISSQEMQHDSDAMEEGRVGQLPTHGADYSKYDTDHLKMMLRPGILHRDEAKFKALIRKELQKREQKSQQGVAEGYDEWHAKELKKSRTRHPEGTGDSKPSKTHEKLKRIPGFTKVSPDEQQRVAKTVDHHLARGLSFDQALVLAQKQGMAEGAKVDRMVKHVAQSEKKLGHSKKEAENIAWATANKRGMLDNKNKKK